MSGFGSQYFGSAPYGLGTPEAAPDLGGKALTHPDTGEQTGSRQIDPATKDYVLDDYGRIAGMSNVHQLVLLAVSTKKGSAAMRQLGHELMSIQRISANFARRADSELRRAVQHLVNRGLVEVVGTSVDIVRPGVARARLMWRDLTSFDGAIQETVTGA